MMNKLAPYYSTLQQSRGTTKQHGNAKEFKYKDRGLQADDEGAPLGSNRGEPRMCEDEGHEELPR